MERLPRRKKKKDLQNKLLEGQYIKQWHQNIFDEETKSKRKKGSNIFGCGAFSSFCPFVYKIITKEEKKTDKQNQVIYSAYIYIKAFLLGRKTGDLIQPPLLHNQINRFTMIHYSAISSQRYLQ